MKRGKEREKEKAKQVEGTSPRDFLVSLIARHDNGEFEGAVQADDEERLVDIVCATDDWLEHNVGANQQAVEEKCVEVRTALADLRWASIAVPSYSQACE